MTADGSTSMEKVIGALGEAFQNKNSGVTFTYNPTGSGSGITVVWEGRCDIGLSSRNLKDEETARGLTGFLLGDTWKSTAKESSFGILPFILTSVYGTAGAIFFGVPVGFFTAVYLDKLAPPKVKAVVESAVSLLAGIPSVVYGLVGMLMFANTFGSCLLAGALTLVIMNLPTVMCTAQESLKTVPASLQEGAFGLGAGKWRVVRTVVLPGCVDGVVTGCILSAGRILGESAALLFTAGFAHTLNPFITGLAGPGATLTVALYLYAKEPVPGGAEASFAIAAILMALTLVINLIAYWRVGISRKGERYEQQHHRQRSVPVVWQHSGAAKYQP